MELLKLNTPLYLKLKDILVRSVNVLLQPLEPDYVSIIIIEREKSGVYCVHTVTDLSLDDTRTLRSLTQHRYIYGKEQDG